MSFQAFAPHKCSWKGQFPNLLFGLLVLLSLVLFWLFLYKGNTGSVVVTAVTTLSVLSHHQNAVTLPVTVLV